MDAARELDDALMQRTFVDAWRVFLRMPGFLSSALFALEPLAPRLTRALNRRSFRTAVPKAAAYLAAHSPDLIMSTHWACGHLFSLAQEGSRFPGSPSSTCTGSCVPRTASSTAGLTCTSP